MTTLLHALDKLGGNGWRLIVAGSGPDEAKYAALVDTLALRQSASFLGELTPNETEALLTAMDALVLPSFMEGMPYVILEAMASSLPVIATRINGIPEAAIDEETAILIPPGDTDALHVALKKLVPDPSRRRELGAQGRKRFEGMFTLRKHAAIMESFYQRLLLG